MTRLLSGYAYLRTGDASRTRLAYDSSIVAFRELDDPVGEAAAFEAMGGLEIQGGNAGRAERNFAAGLQRLGTVRSRVLSWSLRPGLAGALHRRGERDRAAKILRTVMDGTRAGAGPPSAGGMESRVFG